MNLGKFRLM